MPRRQAARQALACKTSLASCIAAGNRLARAPYAAGIGAYAGRMPQA